MKELPTFEELARLEPRLLQMEAEARDVRDDGTGSFFCSNYVWLPMYTRLRSVIGVERRRASRREAREGPLFDNRVFEQVYERFSRLLPPCRACGCHKFEPIREGQIARGEVTGAP